MSSCPLAVSFECTPVREIQLHGSERTPAEAIVEAVADVEDVAPTALPPLYESVDPDALNALVENHSGASDLGVCITYHGWNVFVRGDGRIVVGNPNRTGEPTPLF